MQANARFLNATIGWARSLLGRALALEGSWSDDLRQYQQQLDELHDETAVPYFDLARRLELAPLDSQIVSLCLAAHLDETTRALLGKLHGSPAQTYVTVDAICRLCLDGDMELALYLLHALGSRSTLVRERVVTPVTASAAVSTLRHPVELTTAARELLIGLPPGGGRHFRLIEGPVETSSNRAVVAPELRERLVDAVHDYGSAVVRDAARFRTSDGRVPSPVVLLFGPEGVGKSLLAIEVARDILGSAVHVDCTSLSQQEPGDVLERAVDTAVLRGSALVLEDAHHLLRAGPAARRMRELLLDVQVCTLVTSRDPDLDSKLAELFLVSLEIEAPAPELREAIWQRVLADAAAEDGDIDFGILSERYRFVGRRIASAARLARSRAAAGQEVSPLRMDDVDEVAQLMLNSQMGPLARRLGGSFTLDDIVLPGEQRQQLQDIVDAGHSWDAVMSNWGFANRLPSGKSLTALFWGKPGTGKSFAARIIANLLGKRLFAVNLDQILSKWLGETEKNIHEIFTAASGTGAVLLFDEADSLFASRVEAKTSQDRSNNMITNLLLQEVEEYTGVVVLTTNLKESFDEAFERRMLFSVEFPMPELEERKRIWQTLVPAEAPVAPDVDFDALASRFEFSGGDIKKCLLRAAMSAHASGTELNQTLLVETCAAEYTQSGRLVPL